MVELGQLESHHSDFEARGVRVVAASVEDVADTAQTQEKFPDLTVLSDREQSLARAAGVLGPHHSPTGEEADSPTTVLIDRRGQVRWLFRPARYTTRLAPAELLAAIDQHLPSKP